MLLMSTSTSSPRLTVTSPPSMNSSTGTAPSDLKPKSMTTARSLTPTTVPRTTEPSWNAACSCSYWSSIAPKSKSPVPPPRGTSSSAARAASLVVSVAACAVSVGACAAPVEVGAALAETDAALVEAGVASVDDAGAASVGVDGDSSVAFVVLSAGAVACAALAAASPRSLVSLEGAAGALCSLVLSPLVGFSFSVDMNSCRTPAGLFRRDYYSSLPRLPRQPRRRRARETTAKQCPRGSAEVLPRVALVD